MKDMDFLNDRFAELQDLPVSEETIGAYLEGNLSDGEAYQVQQYMADEPWLGEIVEDINSDPYAGDIADYTSETEYYDDTHAAAGENLDDLYHYDPDFDTDYNPDFDTDFNPDFDTDFNPDFDTDFNPDFDTDFTPDF